MSVMWIFQFRNSFIIIPRNLKFCSLEIIKSDCDISIVWPTLPTPSDRPTSPSLLSHFTHGWVNFSPRQNKFFLLFINCNKLRTVLSPAYGSLCNLPYEPSCKPKRKCYYLFYKKVYEENRRTLKLCPTSPRSPLFTVPVIIRKWGEISMDVVALNWNGITQLVNYSRLVYQTVIKVPTKGSLSWLVQII